MSKNHTKADLKDMVEELINDLMKYKDGTIITTWQLMKAAGYDMGNFEEDVLFDIHDALFKAADANHIILDMSSHEGKLEGLPYNLDFVVHNENANILGNYARL